MTVSELIKTLAELEYQEAEICARGNNSFIVDINIIADCTVHNGKTGCYVLTDGKTLTEEQIIKNKFFERCNYNEYYSKCQKEK